MKCPLCLASTLEPTFVGSTEVDICPTCRGIWLDRGELDRLLGDSAERDETSDEPRRDDRRDREPSRDGRGRDDDWSRDSSKKSKNKKKKKKSNAKRLADLFEEVLDL